VRDGVVDYTGLKKDEESLDSYLEELDRLDPSMLDRDGQLAFWINAYNAFTLKLILDYYPGIGSIKEIPSGKRWKARLWSVNGQMYSLDDIEHKILRVMDEPRIHFSIVCASYSCPDLMGEAYVPERIDEQLDRAAREFLANSEKGLHVAEEEGLIWGTNHVLYLSKIFDWFGEDFEEVSGSVVDFVVPHVSEDVKKFILDNKSELKIRHLDYDWSLNGE
jgi:hypothetical protein